MFQQQQARVPEMKGYVFHKTHSQWGDVAIVSILPSEKTKVQMLGLRQGHTVNFWVCVLVKSVL